MKGIWRTELNQDSLVSLQPATLRGSEEGK